MSLPNLYSGATEIANEEEVAQQAAALEEAALLGESRRAARALWLASTLTIELLDTLVKRERDLLEKARDCRSDPANCRDLLAKSSAIREIIDYATTGKRSI